MNEETKKLLKNLNRRIAELRIEAGLTQDQLAEKRDVPLRTLQYWEADRVISFPNLIKMAKALDREPADFFAVPLMKRAKKGRPAKQTSHSTSKNQDPKKKKTNHHN